MSLHGDPSIRGKLTRSAFSPRMWSWLITISAPRFTPGAGRDGAWLRKLTCRNIGTGSYGNPRLLAHDVIQLEDQIEWRAVSRLKVPRTEVKLSLTAGVPPLIDNPSNVNRQVLLKHKQVVTPFLIQCLPGQAFDLTVRQEGETPQSFRDSASCSGTHLLKKLLALKHGAS